MRVMTGTTKPDRVEPKWAGAVVAILGGGPSLTRAQVDHCRGRARVIAINDAVRLAPWADVLYFCDEQWYRWHEREVKLFRGEVVTLENYELKTRLWRVTCLARDERDGFHDEPDGLCDGSNSGYQAVHLAAHLGAKKIVLLGYDMKPGPGGVNHWFGNHPVPVDSAYDLFLRRFPAIVEPLKKRGIEVVNATPGSALECFPRASLQEVLP